MKNIFKAGGLILATVVLLPAVYAAGSAMTLKQTVMKTIDTNPTIVARVKRWQAAKEGVKGARAGFLPTVDFNTDWGFERAKTNTTFDTQNNPFTTKGTNTYGFGFQIRQMLFDGLATYHEIMRNKKLAAADKFAAIGTADDIALMATQAYLDVLRTAELVTIAQKNYQSHLRIYNMIKRRARSGISRKADRAQASGRLALAKSNLLAAQSHYIDSKTAFNKVVGMMPGDLTMPDAPESQVMPKSEDNAIQWALANHPTYKAAKEDVGEALAQHRASKAVFVPKIDAVLYEDYDRNQGGIKGRYNHFQGGLEMRYNLYRGGADFARHRLTAHQVGEAKAIRDNTHRQVVESMKLSWNAMETARDQLSYFKQHQDSAITTVVNYKKQFKINKRTLLDLLNSENEVFRAKSDYVNGKYNLLFAKFRIFNSAGQLIPYLFRPASR